MCSLWYMERLLSCNCMFAESDMGAGLGLRLRNPGCRQLPMRNTRLLQSEIKSDALKRKGKGKGST